MPTQAPAINTTQDPYFNIRNAPDYKCDRRSARRSGFYQAHLKKSLLENPVSQAIDTPSKLEHLIVQQHPRAQSDHAVFDLPHREFQLTGLKVGDENLRLAL